MKKERMGLANEKALCANVMGSLSLRPLRPSDAPVTLLATPCAN